MEWNHFMTILLLDQGDVGDKTEDAVQSYELEQGCVTKHVFGRELLYVCVFGWVLWHYS